MHTLHPRPTKYYNERRYKDLPIIYTSDKECEKIIISLTQQFGIRDEDANKIINRITKCMLLQNKDKVIKEKAQKKYNYRPKKGKQIELQLDGTDD